jgi:titin
MAETSGMCQVLIFFLLPLSGQSFQQSPSIFSCSEPPRFVSKLSSLTVVAGEPAELQASIEGAQPISVQWLKEKEEVIRESENIRITFVDNVATLQFAKAEPANAGKYICQIKNDGGVRENMATLTVLGWYKLVPNVEMTYRQNLFFS